MLIASAMPVDILSLGAADYALIAAAAFASSFVSGIGGFGGGFLIVLVLTPIVGVKAVVPLIAVFSVASNMSRFIIYFRAIDWPLVVQFVLSSLPGVYVGTTVFYWLPERPLLFLLGIFLIGALPARRYLTALQFRPGLKTVLLIGFVFGVISGTTVGSGMLVIASLLNIGLQGPILLGTDAAIGVINAFSRVLAFRHYGLLSNDLIIAGLVIGLVTAPGTWLASMIVRRTSMRSHTLLIEGLILIGGLSVLGRAIML